MYIKIFDPDGNSALMLVCARLRHVAGTQWGRKKYMNMKHLEAALEDAPISRSANQICAKLLTLPNFFYSLLKNF